MKWGSGYYWLLKFWIFKKVEWLSGEPSHRKQVITGLRTQQVDMGHVGKMKRPKTKNWVQGSYLLWVGRFRGSWKVGWNVTSSREGLSVCIVLPWVRPCFCFFLFIFCCWSLPPLNPFHLSSSIHALSLMCLFLKVHIKYVTLFCILYYGSHLVSCFTPN